MSIYSSNEGIKIHLKKLTKKDKSKMDVMGWHALFSMCEREKAYSVFNKYCNIGTNYIQLDKVDLYIIYNIFGNEVGRFSVSNSEKGVYNRLSDVIIYPKYRKMGIFTILLKTILKKYKKLEFKTSNKYLLSSKTVNDNFTIFRKAVRVNSYTSIDICFRNK